MSASAERRRRQESAFWARTISALAASPIPVQPLAVFNTCHGATREGSLLSAIVQAGASMARDERTSGSHPLGYSARMEPYPGVFVSSVSAEAWEPDPEVGGEMHVLCSGHGAWSGLSRFTKTTEPVRWTLPGRETLLVLEGAARIEIDDGPVLELTAGDIASLPAGARATWHLTTPFREFWVIT
jgi:uncharacterized cupin superfamily protein